jgi:hypothetical protein
MGIAEGPCLIKVNNFCHKNWSVGDFDTRHSSRLVLLAHVSTSFQSQSMPACNMRNG